MKIDEQLRTTYKRQRALADRLKNEVDKEIHARKPSSWHYESRSKEEESFALKIEAGRVKNPDAIEDAFACVIVVPNYSEVKDAERLVIDLYGPPAYKRPESHEITKKAPSDFRFDDLRLYMKYVDQGYGPPTGLAGVIFEVQVRTFLQHAWTIATHDVVYKAENVSWRRERVAHQAKAALEQAEVTIESMAALELSAALPETNDQFTLINEIISTLKGHWEPDQLPRDVRRLAEGVYDLLRNVRLSDADSFRELLNVGQAKYGGKHNLNWSPYRSILQYLAEQQPDKLARFLTNKRSNGSAFVYDSVLAEMGLNRAGAPRATVLDTA